jgi:hypothetical protein
VQSIREPWRSAYAQLNHYFDFAKIKADYADLEIFKCLADKPLARQYAHDDAVLYVMAVNVSAPAAPHIEWINNWGVDQLRSTRL